MKKFLIIENSELEYIKIRSILDNLNKKKDNPYAYSPKSMNHFYEIRDNFHRLNCPKQGVRESSFKYLFDLVQSVDLLLLDFILDDSPLSHKEVARGLDLCSQLNSNTKALIYTRSTTSEVSEIKNQIKKLELFGKVFVIKKPVVSGEREITYLETNLESILS